MCVIKGIQLELEHEFGTFFLWLIIASPMCTSAPMLEEKKQGYQEDCREETEIAKVPSETN